MHFLYPALVALLTLSPTPSNAAKSKDAILLSQVKTLTLRANALTAHRRVSAIPQLSCKGPGCSHYKIDVMRCKNQGSSYSDEDIEWSCTASMPEEFKLGSTEVICEGYSSPQDQYVLKGSCGVEYRLVYTDKGEEKYGWGGNEGGAGSTIFKWGFIVAFLGVLGWILYSAWQGVANQPWRPRPRRGGGGGWGGGGGGGGGPFDPPPPYPGTKPYGTDSEGWRPGFWSGTAAGAAAGYLAGNRNNRQQEPLLNNNRGSGWFGGGNGDGSPSRSGSSSSGTSTRHESTGFGSTTRR